MKIQRKIFDILMVLILSLGVVGCSNTASGDVVAKVGNVKIYKQKIDEQVDYQTKMMTMQYGEDFVKSEQGQEYLNSMKSSLLDSFINVEVAILKAKELGIEVTKQEVDEQYELEKSDFQSEEAFNEALKTTNMTKEKLIEEITQSLTVSKLVKHLTKDVTIEDSELETFYNNNIASFTTKAGANISHILVPTLEQAQDIKKEYIEGTSFEDLASKYGTDGTKTTGGFLDYIPYDTTEYDKDFMTGAKTLSENEISEPIKTKFGYHLIKATDVVSEDFVIPFTEAKDDVYNEVFNQKEEQIVNNQVEAWKKEMKITKYENKL